LKLDTLEGTTLKKRLLAKLAPIILAGCEFIAAGTIFGRQLPPTEPDRGVAPMLSYSISDFETIDVATGNLIYQFPIAKLPPGRRGLTAGLALTYNSTIYDANVQPYQWPDGIQSTSWLVPSNTGGGWRYNYNYNYNYNYSYNYGLLEETVNDCSVTPYVERLSVVFPDGSRHILQLYNGGMQNDAGGGGIYLPNGAVACAGANYPAITSGLLTYFTTDGTFLKVVIAASADFWTNGEWSLFTPDGLQITGYGSQATVVFDPDSNNLAIYNLNPYAIVPAVETVIEDQFGRSINVQYASFQDTITQTGYMGNSTASWTVAWTQVNVNSGSTSYTCTQSGDTCYGSTDYNALGSNVVQSISVSSPGNQTVTYSFSYSPYWNELQQVTLPSAPGETPATVVYTYQDTFTRGAYATLLYNPVARKVVNWQEIYDGQSAPAPPDVWTYTYNGPTVVTGPDGGQTTYSFSNTLLNLVTQINYPDGSQVNRTWYQNYPYLPAGGPLVNPYIQQEIRTVGGQTAMTKTYSVDENGNQTNLTESWAGLGVTARSTASAYYLYTQGASNGPSYGPDSTNAYWNPATMWSGNGPFRLVRSAVTVQGSAAAVREYGYSSTGDLTDEWDWNSAFALSEPLTALNAVHVQRTNGFFGNLTQVADGRSISTNYTYDSNNLLITQKSVGGVLQDGYVFDFTSGLLSTSTDANGVQTLHNYDALNRLLFVSEGGNATTTSYQDANRRVIVTDGVGRVTITERDQLRRVALNRQLENPATQSVNDSSAGIKVQTRYRNVPANSNSYRLVSSPYRASTSAGASGEETMGWTLTTLDNAGRVLNIRTFSGSALPAPWGTNNNSTALTTYSYNGYTTTVSAPAGATRVLTVDGLGRLIQVQENGIGPAGSNATTNYTYDGLDNLITVTQGTQTRSFTYDSLNRLITAVNAESGTTCYAYDNDGNLSSRTQVANSSCGGGILTSYYYDYLNRMTSKVLPEGTATYAYDQGSYGIGRLYSVSFGGLSTTYSVHDSLGRVTAHTQMVNGVSYNFSYTYDATGDLTSMTYPSGRQLLFTYDTAFRVNGVTSATAAYAASVTYGAQGAVGSFQIGNGLWETTNFNSLLQTRQVSLGSCSQTGGPGSPACSQDQWWLQNIYGTPSNNGNILQQNIGLPGGITIPEAYSYDTANRLTVASEQSSNPSNPPFPDANCRYCEGYTYDIWGNRTEAVGGLLGPSTLAPGSFSPYTNQITSAGWAYETTGRGNITQEPGGRTYLYDSENRQVAFCTQDPGGCVNQSGPGRTLYVYDGDGRRVQKSEPAGTTTYVYDAQGNLAAEYSTEPGTSQTLYLTADQLGTTRVVTTGTPGASSVVARRDYLPFGEQIVPASGDPRLNVTGYTQSEGVTLQFTGMERDGASGESGLDYFGARYFSGAQGRFTSPDDPLIDQDPADPQSWNLYSYVRNNPLGNTDPTGQDCVTTSNQTSTSVSAAVAAGGTEGGCTESGGAWVPGTVNINSLTYNGSSIGYSYTPYDTNSLTSGGTIPLGTGPVDALSPSGQEFYNQMSARTESSNHMIAEFGMAQAMFAGIYGGTYAIPAAIAALPAFGETGAVGPGVGLLRLAQKYGLNLNSPKARQILENLDMSVEEFVGKFRQGSIKQAAGWRFDGMTVRQALDSGGRKLLTDGRFDK